MPTVDSANNPAAAEHLAASPPLAHAPQIAAEFAFPSAALQQTAAEYGRQMAEGLVADGATLSQIPSYVSAVPDGRERGLYLAVDLGGTNFRVCAVRLHGNGKYELTTSKTPVPEELMNPVGAGARAEAAAGAGAAGNGKGEGKGEADVKGADALFDYLAGRVEEFLRQHLADRFESHREKVRRGEEGDAKADYFDLGFTFSFPVQQTAINRGRLLRWTKGYDIPDAVGQDVCQLLQRAFDARRLPVRVAALVNDTVGTLMARAYTSGSGGSGGRTAIAAIFGTGTNGAYIERLERITKLVRRKPGGEGGDYDRSTGEMIVNCEWGSFDNTLRVLPATAFDTALDGDSVNPGFQMFEKRISGLFLGELFRRALIALAEENDGDNAPAGGSALHLSIIPSTSPLRQPWGIDTSLLSAIKADSTRALSTVATRLHNDLGLVAPNAADRTAARLLVDAIVARAARLAAAALGAIIVATGRLTTAAAEGEGEGRGKGGSTGAGTIDVGVDGSVIEFVPGFEGALRAGLREIDGIGPAGEARVSVGVAKDGSGVGAALAALVARQAAARNANAAGGRAQ